MQGSDITATIRAHAPRLAACCLEALGRRYPHKLDHVMSHDDDRPRPADIHPVFSGAFDWHSSVHMHASLLRLRDLVPDAESRSSIERHLDACFTEALVARERAYAAEPARAAFERPYGWAWLLRLQAQLEACAADERASRWAAAVRPFARDIAARLADFLPRGPYPVRCGTHANSAFAMLLARDYALAVDDARLLEAIDATARSWFAADEDYPARYEPGGGDFLPAGLVEALLMSRVLGGDFAAWWRGFDPRGKALEHWCLPVAAADRGDPQLVHLAGLNFSRAWCLRALSTSVQESQRPGMLAAAAAQWAASWPFVCEGDFMATHWLLGFAMLSLDVTT